MFSFRKQHPKRLYDSYKNENNWINILIGTFDERKSIVSKYMRAITEIYNGDILFKLSSRFNTLMSTCDLRGMGVEGRFLEIIHWNQSQKKYSQYMGNLFLKHQWTQSSIVLSAEHSFRLSAFNRYRIEEGLNWNLVETRT